MELDPDPFTNAGGFLLFEGRFEEEGGEGGRGR